MASQIIGLGLSDHPSSPSKGRGGVLAIGNTVIIFSEEKL